MAEGVLDYTQQSQATPVPKPSTALAPPNVAESYKTVGEQIKNEPLKVTSGYQSPFTINAETGQLEGQPRVAGSETYITPQSTVAGQLDQLLKTESPLMKTAEASAKERASALGMSSSSMAVGAAQKALIESALPIAQQDAQQAFQLKQQQQAIDYEQTKIETEALVAGALNLQKAQLAEQQAKIQQGWEATLRGLDQQANLDTLGYKSALTREENAYNTQLSKDMKAFETDLQKQLTQLQSDLNKELQLAVQKQTIDAQIQGTLINQAQDMLNNYQISIQQLLGNQAFLDSMPDSASMRSLFNEMFQTVSSSIRYSAKAAGVYNPTMQQAIDEMVAANMWS